MAKGAGYFAKDDDYGTRMDEQYAQGEQFVVLSIEADTPFTNPKTGEVIKTRTKMLTRTFNPETLKAEGVPQEVKTLSGPIHERLNDLTDGDFPAVCQWTKVNVEKWNTEATVLKKVCAYPVPEEYAQYLNE